MASEEIILLVEDNADDACIVGIALRKAGITNRLETMRNPVEAMRYLEGEGPYALRAAYPLPALILISADLRLVSGEEVLRWMGRRPHLRALPVVLLSDFPLSEGSLAGLPPFAQTVVKPSDFGELVALMHRLRLLLPHPTVPAQEWRLTG